MLEARRRPTISGTRTDSTHARRCALLRELEGYALDNGDARLALELLYLRALPAPWRREDTVYLHGLARRLVRLVAEHDGELNTCPPTDRYEGIEAVYVRDLARAAQFLARVTFEMHELTRDGAR